MISRHLAKSLAEAERLGKRTLASALRGLLSREQFAWALHRERDRSDRADEPFSLAVLSVGKPKSGRDALVELAGVLRQRLRLSDQAGMLAPRTIGILLPATPPADAWTMVDDLCACIPAEFPLPDCSVYCYFGNGRSGEDLNDDMLCEPGAPRRPVHPLQPLFAQPLPLWKRACDVVAASLGLVILAPVFAVVAIAIKATSRGPVLFRQARSGLGGRRFMMLKFRSMVTDAEARRQQLLALNEQDGPAFKIKNDPRVTPIGGWLRRLSLDELPQLINVLRGEMSLVGPRPLPCAETAGCSGWLRQRLDVTPGLTCIWQVRGRSAVSFDDWARMDVQYIRSRSPLNDARLLLQTIPAVVSRRGAC